MNMRLLTALGMLLLATTACAADEPDDADDTTTLEDDLTRGTRVVKFEAQGSFRHVHENEDYLSPNTVVSTPLGDGTVTITLKRAEPARVVRFDGKVFNEPTYTADLRVDYPAATGRPALTAENVKLVFSDYFEKHVARGLPPGVSASGVISGGRFTTFGLDVEKVGVRNDRIEFLARTVARR